MLNKIHHPDYRRMIEQHAAGFSPAETALLQEQALAQAVLQQSRFDPNAGHWAKADDDEDTVGICPHCINPPAPPLRDYLMWREKQAG